MASRTMSVAALLNQVRDDEVVLPDLQRDFVWKEDQIRLLLDSMLRGYPVGSLLLWNTQFTEVPYREFVRDYRTGQTYATKVKAPGKRQRMVLDGQQRLQSLFLAIYGTYDGRRAYFNITSGPGAAQEDTETGKNYRFEFWRDEDSNRPKRLVRVADIVSWAARHEDEQFDRVVAEVQLEGAEATLARRNLRLLRSIVNHDLVPVEIIDEEVMNADQARSINEILEIFVRVNSGGTKLTRSDLMFSLIKSKWGPARHSFDTLIHQVNPLGVLPIDKDFIIKGLLTVADRPPTFDVENVERHWKEMADKFDLFAQALKSALDFCQDPEVGIRSHSFLSPINSLLPLVYYLSRRDRGSVPDSQRGALKTFLYFLLFNEFVTSDARIRYLREVLQRGTADQLPLDNLLREIERKQRQSAKETTAEMLQWNPRLALNLVQPEAAREVLSWQSKAEVDHIFPQSVFRPKFGDLVDDIGNLAFLGKLRNIRKSDSQPWEYFADTSDESLRDHFLIEDRKLLAAESFPTFVAERRGLILRKVKERLGR